MAHTDTATSSVGSMDPAQGCPPPGSERTFGYIVRVNKVNSNRITSWITRGAEQVEQKQVENSLALEKYRNMACNQNIKNAEGKITLKFHMHCNSFQPSSLYSSCQELV